MSPHAPSVLALPVSFAQQPVDASARLVVRPGYVKADAGPLTIFLSPNGSIALRRGPTLLGQGGVRTSNKWGQWQPLWSSRTAAHKITERTAQFETKTYRETVEARENSTVHVTFALTPGERKPEILGVGFEMPITSFLGKSLRSRWLHGSPRQWFE